MQFPLKIAHRGIILVLVPLVCELLFLAVLTILLARADYVIRREAEARQIIYLTGSVERLAADCATAAACYKFTHMGFFKQRSERSSRALFEKIDELEERLKGKPDLLARMHSGRHIAGKALGLIAHVIAKVDQKELPQAPNKVLGSIAHVSDEFKMLEDMNDNLAHIVEAERREAIAISQQERRARSAVGVALGVGFILNILIALALAIFFSKGITKRLYSVMENTRRVPKGQPLNPPVQGADEIAELDNVFHKMVNELEQTQQMKQYLLSMVSHDLRSPLTTVQAALSLLAAGALGKLPERAEKKVQLAELDLERLIRLTNDLLDSEKLATGKLDIVPIATTSGQIIEDAAGAMQSFAELHKVQLTAVSDSTKMMADRARLVQVLTNFLSNAIKYSPEGSAVTVSVRVDDNQAEFSVSDQGKGIAPEYHELIFEKFRQVSVDDASTGKGFGLAICKSIVELHGGRVGVRSELNKGSTFWFSVPLVRPV